MKTIELAQRTREQLTLLTGFKTETVSSVMRNNGGWNMTVEVVEMKRIPDSSDMLGTYEVELDGEGDVVTYKRVRRYQRAQALGN